MALVRFAIGTAMLLIGLGFPRVRPNPQLGYLDPSTPFFRRVMLVAGISFIIVSLVDWFGGRP